MTRLISSAVVLAAAVASWIALPAVAQEIVPHEPLWTAPPTLWATPLDGGPIRVRFVVPRDAESEVAALSARAELRSDVSLYDPGEPAAAVASALDEKFDVVVISGVSLEAWPESALVRLGEHLHQGRGVVLFDFGAAATSAVLQERYSLGPADARLLDAVAPEALSIAPDASIVSVLSGAAGRAVVVQFPGARAVGQCVVPATDGSFEFPTVYENYLSLAVQCVRWAARREPAARIESLEHVPTSGPESVITPPQLPQGFVDRMHESLNPTQLRNFVLSLDAPAPKNYGVRVQLRYPGRGVQWSYDAQEAVRKGATSTALAIPAGSGEFFIDVWLMDRLDVVDWFTEAVVLPGRPQIGDVRIGPSVAEPNDRLRVSLNVAPNARNFVSTASGSNSRTAGQSTVIARIVDPLGRVAAQRSYPVPGGEGVVRLDVPIADWLGPYGRAEIFVTEGFDENASWWLRQTASYAAADVYFRQPRPPGLSWIADAPGGGGHWARGVRQRLVALGVDRVFVDDAARGATVAADGLQTVVQLPALTSLCGGDFGEASAEGQRIRVLATENAALRPGLYTITYNPLATSDDACTAGFADFLARRYAQVEQLNGVWSAAHADWTAAALGAADSITGRGDRALFQARMLEAHRAAAQSILRRSDPQALVGVLGAPTSGFRVLGADPVELAPPALGRAEYTAVRTVLAEGDYADAHAQWLPWFAALHGADALWLNAIDHNSLGQTDVTSLTALASAVDAVRAGHDLLFRGAVRPAPKALVIEAMPGASEGSSADWIQLLESHLVPYEVAPGYALEDVNPARYSLAIVPARSDITATAAAWLSRFYDAGGAIAMDSPPDAMSSLVATDAGRALSFPAPIDLDDWNRDDEERLVAWLAEAGASPPNDLKLPDKFRGQVRDLRVGAARVVAVLRAPEGKSSETVRFDVAKNEHLYAPFEPIPGQTRRAFARLAPGGITLFSVLPYEVTRLVVDAPSSADPGRRLEIIATVKTQGALPGLHVLHVRLIDPAGKPLKLYDRTIVARDGHGAARIPLAFNEVPGRYTIVVRDVLTGTEATAELKVN